MDRRGGRSREPRARRRRPEHPDREGSQQAVGAQGQGLRAPVSRARPQDAERGAQRAWVRLPERGEARPQGPAGLGRPVHVDPVVRRLRRLPMSHDGAATRRKSQDLVADARMAKCGQPETRSGARGREGVRALAPALLSDNATSVARVPRARASARTGICEQPRRSSRAFARVGSPRRA